MMARIIVIFCAFLFGLTSSVNAKPRVLIFAAASMKNVMDAIGAEFEKDCECKVVISYAGSGQLARQIEAGAPADIFVSADMDWIDWLEEQKAITAGSSRIIAGNDLVVIVSKDDKTDTKQLEISLGQGRIAMANPMSVPAGRYGKQALETAGIWSKFSRQMVYGENVRISLAMVARGDVGAAIVYHSDALIEPKVKIAYQFASSDHEEIVYPAVQISSNSLATNLMEYFAKSSTQKLFRHFGFTGRD